MEEKKNYHIDEEEPILASEPLAGEEQPTLGDWQKPRFNKTMEAVIRYKGNFWTNDPKYAWPR